jgi:hypothetical protein
VVPGTYLQERRWQCHQVDRDRGDGPCRQSSGQTCQTSRQVRPERADGVSSNGLSAEVVRSKRDSMDFKPFGALGGRSQWLGLLVGHPQASVLVRRRPTDVIYYSNSEGLGMGSHRVNHACTVAHLRSADAYSQEPTLRVVWIW